MQGWLENTLGTWDCKPGLLDCMQAMLENTQEKLDCRQDLSESMPGMLGNKQGRSDYRLDSLGCTQATWASKLVKLDCMLDW